MELYMRLLTLATLVYISELAIAIPRKSKIKNSRKLMPKSGNRQRGQKYAADDGDMTIDQVINKAREECKSKAPVNKIIAEDLEMEAKGDIVLSELDMMFTKDEYERLQQNELPLYTKNGRSSKTGSGSNKRTGRNMRKSVRGKRASTIDERKYWPNAVVPFIFHDNANFSKSERELFDAAVEDYSKYTCVQWKPKTDADKGRFVVVQDRSGCWSYIGMHNFQAGQPLSLAPRCRSKGVMIHEMMHALGAYHEQSRADRDDYITVNIENVYDGAVDNYKKKSVDEQQVFDVPYDYESVMHYGAFTFAKNYSYPVIETKDKSEQSKIGQRRGLNFQDIHLITHMYKCTEHCPLRNCPKEGFQGKDCKCWCPTGNPDNLVKECDQQGTTRPRPTTTTTTEAPVCPVRYSACKCDRAPRTACSHFEKSVCNTKTGACECEYGFRLSRGECIVDRSVIRETIQKPSSGNKCINKYSQRNCEGWADKGYCSSKSHSNFMSTNCQHACVCHLSKPTIQSSASTCEDEEERCAKWADAGFCKSTSSYFEFMTASCKKSCGLCPEWKSSDSGVCECS